MLKIAQNNLILKKKISYEGATHLHICELWI